MFNNTYTSIRGLDLVVLVPISLEVGLIFATNKKIGIKDFIYAKLNLELSSPFHLCVELEV
jgi:hypothetical protein